MQKIEIQAEGFFALLKERGVSMWSIFKEMLNQDEEQLLIFMGTDGKAVAEYILPSSEKRLEEDRQLFTKHFKEKLQDFL